jgi:hypothetical protein
MTPQPSEEGVEWAASQEAAPGGEGAGNGPLSRGRSRGTRAAEKESGSASEVKA